MSLYFVIQNTKRCVQVQALQPCSTGRRRSQLVSGSFIWGPGVGWMWCSWWGRRCVALDFFLKCLPLLAGWLLFWWRAVWRWHGQRWGDRAVADCSPPVLWGAERRPGAYLPEKTGGDQNTKHRICKRLPGFLGPQLFWKCPVWPCVNQTFRTMTNNS